MLLMKGILQCDVQNSTNNGISYLLFGAGFLPSTVDLGPTENCTARKKRTKSEYDIIIHYKSIYG